MLGTLKGVYMKKIWKLLRKSFNTSAELWKTPTKWLVCKKHERYYKFFDTEKEATEFFDTIKDKK